jgi:hypothetical protein
MVDILQREKKKGHLWKERKKSEWMTKLNYYNMREKIEEDPNPNCMYFY